MYVFDNLGMCHNADGIPPVFAGRPDGNARRVSATGSRHKNNAPELSPSEMLILTMIAKQLLEARI